LVELSLSDREREYAQVVQAAAGLAPTPPRIGWTCPAIDKAIRRVRRFAEGQERAELIALLEQVRSENIGMRKRLEHLEGVRGRWQTRAKETHMERINGCRCPQCGVEVVADLCQCSWFSHPEPALEGKC